MNPRFPPAGNSGVRCFRKISAIHLAAVALLALLAAAPLAAPAPEPPPRGEYDGFQAEGDIRRFENENLYYDISFLWFDKAATAEVHFYKKNDEYQSLLVAETKGFVGWVTSYRKHIYRSYFEVVDNGKRLRTRRFERQVIIGDRVEQTINTMDYNTRINHWQEYHNGELTAKDQREIPPDTNFDDILASFYNFRNGVYGKVRKESNYVIHTIPEKGVDKITIKTHTDAEQDQVRQQQERPVRDELLLRVFIPKEIFKTKTGELLFWGSRHLIPLDTTVVEYLVLGDLHASFVRRTNGKGEVPDIARIGKN